MICSNMSLSWFILTFNTSLKRKEHIFVLIRPVLRYTQQSHYFILLFPVDLGWVGIILGCQWYRIHVSPTVFDARPNNTYPKNARPLQSLDEKCGTNGTRKSWYCWSVLLRTAWSRLFMHGVIRVCKFILYEVFLLPSGSRVSTLLLF